MTDIKLERLQRENLSYAEYIQSDRWRKFGKECLLSAERHCQLFPWVRVGRHKDGYHPYNIHHVSREAYARLGEERWNRDAIVLCRFAHLWVFHWLLSGGKKRPSRQKQFPNRAQAIANAWCRLPRSRKLRLGSVLANALWIAAIAGVFVAIYWF